MTNPTESNNAPEPEPESEPLGSASSSAESLDPRRAEIAEWLERLGVLASGSQLSSTTHSAESESILDGLRETLLLTISREAMACEFEVLLNQNQYPTGADVAFEVLGFVEELESLLSVYKPRSELSVLNRFGSERPVPVSFDTQAMLELAVAIHNWTDGAFDITAGSLSEVWGFSRRSGRKPTDEEIQTSLQTVGTPLLTVDATQATAALAKPGVVVNPGGIGKGYALDRAAGRLCDAGVNDFMMHGGLSSVTARGHRSHPDTGGGWIVSLKHPWRIEEQLGTIRLRNRSLGTSGSGKQFFHFGGKRYSHIIDPRTGWPAQGMSATVVCPSAAICDALATAFFIMGADATQQFCDAIPEVAAVLVFQDAKTGRQCIEAFNMTTDMWSPGRSFGG